MASANAELTVQAAPGDVVYVGPRPFETGEKLYGRDREASELLSLLIAERIVLLHSPSGAGKTSVVQALLLPEIRDEGFVVPESADENRRGKPLVIRVNNPRPSGAPQGCNRYALSAMLSLEEHRAEAQRRSPELLAGMDLDAYLRSEFAVSAQGSAKQPPLLLVFDQFEEVLTLDPTDRPAKEAFFKQLGTALCDRTRWALFATRDDFVAALEPYRNQIPTGLSVNYRLDFLSERQARDAIVEPAREAGAEFVDKLVVKLLEELRLVRVQQPDGTFKEELGPSVEPVQLQVVCRRLWQGRKDPARVTLDDLEAIKGDQGVGIDVVLADYYAVTVSDAALAGKIDERVVREWFGRQLIVAGIRRPALKGDESAFGINAQCLAVLDKAFLIRSEPRGGAFWYELAHDRLIVPVLKNNERWRVDHLNEFQLQAERWEQRKRPSELLVRGELLSKGESWDAATPDGKKTQAEKDFLNACRETVSQERKKGQFLRTMVILGTAVVVFGSLSLFYKQQSNLSYRESEFNKKQSDFNKKEAARFEDEGKKESQRRKEAELEGLVLQTQGKSQPDGHSAVADALKVMETASSSNIDSHAAEGLLRTAMASIGWEQLPLSEKPIAAAGNSPSGTRAEEKPVTAAAFSPDGRWLAVGRPATIVLWKIDQHGRLSRPSFPKVDSFGGPSGRVSTEISALSFSPDDRHLVVGFGDGCFEILVPETPGARPMTLKRVAHHSAVREIVVSSDSKWFTTVALDGTAMLWSFDAFERVQDLTTIGNSVVTSLAFTPFPKRMYFGTTDGMIHSLNLVSNPPEIDRHRLISDEVTSKPVTALAVHPSAKMMAVAWSGGYTGFQTLYMDPSSREAQGFAEVIGAANNLVKNEKTPNPNSVASLDFSDDGRWLVSLNRDHQMQLWAVTNDSKLRVQETFSDIVLPLQSVKFEPTRMTSRQTKWLLGEVGDGTVLLWDLSAPKNVPRALRGHKGPLTVTSFDPRGKWLLTSCFDGTNRLWDIERLADKKSSAEPRVFLHDSPILNGAFSTAQNKNRIATFTEHGELREFDLDTRKDRSNLVLDSAVLPSSINRSCLAYSGDGDSLLLIATSDMQGSNDAIVWRPSSDEIVRSEIPYGIMFPNTTPYEAMKHFVGWGDYTLSADSRFLAAFDPTKNPVVVDLSAPKTPRAIRVRVFDKAPPFESSPTLELSPDGKYLVVAQKDLGVKLWGLQSSEGKTVLLGEASIPWQDTEKPVPLPGATEIEIYSAIRSFSISALACSNDGKSLAAASDSLVWLWERSGDQSFKPPTALRGHTDRVSVLLFTRDGSSLVSGSDDSTVRVWQIKPTPKLSAFVPLIGHKGPITSAALNRDGNYLLTTSTDGTARLWALDRDTLLSRAREMEAESAKALTDKPLRY
jgi:WD40 repeat protein